MGDRDSDGDLRAQLEAAQAITHIGSWRWDIATGVVTWSDELYRIYGLEPRSRAITLELFLGFIHPDERDRIRREVETALERRGKFAYVELIVRPDGTTRNLDTMGEVQLDANGAPIALIGTCRDITEATQRERTLQFYGDVFAHAQIGLSAWRDDSAGPELVAFNAATEALGGSALAGRIGDLFGDSTKITTELAGRTILATRFPLPGAYFGLALEDITLAHQAHLIAQGEKRALEMLASGAAVAEILTVIVETIEAASHDIIASILLVDESGTRLRHGAAPGLPEAYLRAVDGALIGPSAGSCGTAVFRREPVYVADIATDPLWATYQQLPLPKELHACWSSPVRGSDGRVLGTFALYRAEPGLPDEAARALMARATHVTGIVLERRALDDQLRALTGRIEAVREDERTKIAREIHDELGQALTALKLDIGWLARRIQDQPLTDKLDSMSRSADEVLRAVRRISSDLRPGVLEHLGLLAAIEWQAEQFEERTGTRCEVRSAIGDLGLDRDLATALFRIFQEALTNVARHASARRVEVDVRLQRGCVVLEIADDGTGIPEVGRRDRTLGILGMGERARRLGGDCIVKRREPRGTVVSVTIPLRFPADRLADLGG